MLATSYVAVFVGSFFGTLVGIGLLTLFGWWR